MCNPKLGVGPQSQFFRICDLSARGIPLSATKFYSRQTAATSLYPLRQERATYGISHPPKAFLLPLWNGWENSKK